MNDDLAEEIESLRKRAAEVDRISKEIDQLQKAAEFTHLPWDLQSDAFDAGRQSLVEARMSWLRQLLRPVAEPATPAAIGCDPC